MVLPMPYLALCLSSAIVVRSSQWLVGDKEDKHSRRDKREHHRTQGSILLFRKMKKKGMLEVSGG